jgi:ADP-ribose pyrophosphatase YjhB (NUDIX family)
VTHAGNNEAIQVLPGGHLEVGEDVRTAISRELIEELGVVPVVGDVLYIHSFTDSQNRHSVEFIFQIENGHEYINCETLVRSHAAELHSIEFVSPTEAVTLLPIGVRVDFLNGVLGDGCLRYLHNGLRVDNH